MSNMLVSANLWPGRYGPSFTTTAGAPGSAGTNETRVDRPNEGLSGVSTTDNPATSAGVLATPTRGNFDTYHAVGYVSKQVAQIDTTQLGVTVWRAQQYAAPGPQTIAPQNYTVPGAATFAEAPVNT